MVLVAGKYNIDSGGHGVLAPPGSILVVTGALVMFWMFATTSAEVDVATKGMV
jgi:hypothetical protein